MAITTRQEFIDYCKRKLGYGAINIEITPEQESDAVDLAIKTFNEFHFDGIERDFLHHKITRTDLTVADASGFSAGDIITGDNTAEAEIYEINGNVITTEYNETGYEFTLGEDITNGTVTQTLTGVTLGDMDKGWIDGSGDIMGIIRVLNVTTIFGSSGANAMWDPKYQLMMHEINNLTSSGGVNYYYSMRHYLANLDFILRREKSFRFNRRQNQIHLDINWNRDFHADDWVVIECYKAVNPETYSEVWEDLWLGKYATALMKKYWGSNLKKYSGMMLPGNVVYDGQQIYNEAVEEIAVLEQHAIEQSAPLDMFIG